MIYTDNFYVVSDSPKGWYSELRTFAKRYKISLEYLCVENGIPHLTIYGKQNRSKLSGSDAKFVARRVMKYKLQGKKGRKLSYNTKIDYSVYARPTFAKGLMVKISKHFNFKGGPFLYPNQEFTATSCMLTVQNKMVTKFCLFISDECPRGKLWFESRFGDILMLEIPEHFQEKIDLFRTYVKQITKGSIINH